MELHELSQQERKNIITDINKIMSEKYNISDSSINNFWNALTVGVIHQIKQCDNQNSEIMYG